MLMQLAAAHDAFMELQNNLKEGAKFYNDLTQVFKHSEDFLSGLVLFFQNSGCIAINYLFCSSLWHSKTKYQIFVLLGRLKLMSSLRTLQMKSQPKEPQVNYPFYKADA